MKLAYLDIMPRKAFLEGKFLFFLMKVYLEGVVVNLEEKEGWSGENPNEYLPNPLIFNS